MFDVLKLGLFFVSRISLPHKIDFHKHTYAFLTMYLVGPPRPWDLQKSPPLVGLIGLKRLREINSKNDVPTIESVVFYCGIVMGVFWGVE